MKKIKFYSLLCAVFLMTSCQMFEMDNYDEPSETIWGEVVDEATGKRVLTDQGSEGIRVRLTELSWGENVQHNPDFYCMLDGTFRNTKIFEGDYNIRIDGPFIPLVRENTDGTLLFDGSQNTRISGTTKVKFEVQPFLNVEFVGDPQVSNGVISAKVKVTRGVTNEIFREKIEPMGNWKDEYLNITDIQLFVSYSSTVGYRARDDDDVDDNGGQPHGGHLIQRQAESVEHDAGAQNLFRAELDARHPCLRKPVAQAVRV